MKAAKDEANAAKERIGNLEAQVRRCRKQLAMLPSLRSLPAMLLSLLAFLGMRHRVINGMKADRTQSTSTRPQANQWGRPMTGSTI